MHRATAPTRPTLRTRLSRRLVALLAATPVLLVPVVALPVTTPSAHRPHPVAPTITSMPVAVPGGRVSHATQLTTSGQLTTRHFTSVGVTWAAQRSVAPLHVSVRVRSDHRWGAWNALDAATADLPDDDVLRRDPSLRWGTEPLFVGDADGVQVRVTAAGRGSAPRDVKVELVDAGTSPADAGDPVPPDSASALPSQPAIYTRAQWGADESLMNWTPEYSATVKAVFIHHTDTTNAYYTRSQAMQQVRGVYAYHARSLGWGDIGYNFLVDRFGDIFEGRYGGMDSTVIGGHTYGFNHYTSGIALLGTYSSTRPSSAQVTSVERLAAWKLGRYHRDPLGYQYLTSEADQNTKYPTGSTVRFSTISGHRDAYYTDCPGSAAYTLLSGIRKAAAAILGPRIVDPTALAIPPGNGNSGAVRFSAKTVGTSTWTVTLRDAGGGAVETWSGTTSPITVTWGLRYGNRYLVPGRYTAHIAASSSNAQAQSADVPVVISASGGARPLYPDGTILTWSGSYWRVDGTSASTQVRRKLLGSAGLASFPGASARAIPVTRALLLTMTPAGWEPYRDGSFLAGVPSGSTYVVSQGKKRPIDAATIAVLGYGAPTTVPDADLALVPTGTSVTGPAHPPGSFVSSNGSTYAIVASSTGTSYLRPVVSTTALSTWVPTGDVLQANAADQALTLDTYARGLADGVVFTDPTGTYVVSRGRARAMSSSTVWAQLGFRAAMQATSADLGHDLSSVPSAGPSIDSTSTTITLTAGGLDAPVSVASWAQTLPGSADSQAAGGNPARP